MNTEINADRRASGGVWTRLTIRFVVIVIIALAGMTALAPAAAADVCTDAPDPVKPKSGLPGMLTTMPKHIPDEEPNPFTDKSVPIGSVYGYNWHWNNYDLGCGPDFLRDPVAVSNTQTGNVILSQVGAAIAGLASLEQMAKTSSLSWLTDVTRNVADKLGDQILTVWLPLAVVTVGLIVGYRARRSNYADTARTLLIVVGVIAIVVFALVYPGMASRTVDKAVVTVADQTGKQFSASPSDSITRESAYRTWLTGNFGNPDSQVAKELGPRLMDATHYSWTEMKQIWADPSGAKQKEIDEAKAAEFQAVAQELKDRDPAGYEVFTGRGERTGPAMFGIVVVMAMGLFVALAMIMVLIARVMVQAIALAAPFVAVLGVLPTHTTVLSRLWDLFTAALVAVAKFVIAGGVMAMVLGSIHANDQLGAGAKLFWIVVATVVGIVLTRPVRSFKTIIPGLDPNQSYIRAAMSGLAGYFGARLGSDDRLSAVADQARKDVPPDPARESRQDHTPRVALEMRESLDALPPPPWTTTEPTTRRSEDMESVQIVRLDEPRTAAPATDGQEPRWERGRAWPGVVAAPAPAELPAAPRRLEARPTAGDRMTHPSDSSETDGPTSNTSASPLPSQTGSVGPVASISSESRVHPALNVEPAASIGPGTSDREDLRSSEADGSAADVSRGDSARPRTPSQPPPRDSEVIYPTGVIVTDEDVPLYRSSLDGTDRNTETYIRLPDGELAEDGSEHAMVTYHSRRDGGRHGSA